MISIWGTDPAEGICFEKNFRINDELVEFIDTLELVHARTQSEINLKLSRRASFGTGSVVNIEP